MSEDVLTEKEVLDLDDNFKALYWTIGAINCMKELGMIETECSVEITLKGRRSFNIVDRIYNPSNIQIESILDYLYPKQKGEQDAFVFLLAGYRDDRKKMLEWCEDNMEEAE